MLRSNLRVLKFLVVLPAFFVDFDGEFLCKFFFGDAAGADADFDGGDFGGDRLFAILC